MANTSIYIGNLPYTATGDELRALFPSREIRRVTIAFDPDTRKPKGFGFVEFASAEDAIDVVKILDGTQFGGRTLKVQMAKDRKDKPPRSKK